MCKPRVTKKLEITTIKLIETAWRNEIGITMVIMWTSQRSVRVSVLIM